jgi:mono/diheme cytochrome c family protein
MRLFLTCALVSLAAFFAVACSGVSQNTAANNPVANPAGNSAGNPSDNSAGKAEVAVPAPIESPAPAPSASPLLGATPSTVPTTPVGPVGPTTPTGQPSAGQNSPESEQQRMAENNLPVTVSSAQPGMTPAPDPFPPRPTPTIVMKDGKIVQEWQASEEAMSLVNPVKSSPDAAQIGREYYMQRCADCHGKEGKGNGYMSKTLKKPPTNLASQVVQANSDGELFWKITNGRSPMPANRIRFTDEQRWFIVAYLRTLKP